MFAPHLGHRYYHQERMLLDYLALGLLWSHVSASLVTFISASLVTSCLRSRGAFLLMSGAVGGWGGGDEARIELRWGD